MIKFKKKEVVQNSLTTWDKKPIRGMTKEIVKETISRGKPMIEEWIRKLKLDKDFTFEIYAVEKIRINKKDSFSPFIVFHIIHKRAKGKCIVDNGGNVRTLFGDSKQAIKTKKILITKMEGTYSFAGNGIERYINY